MELIARQINKFGFNLFWNRRWPMYPFIRILKHKIYLGVLKWAICIEK